MVNGSDTALTWLDYGLARGEGVVLISGEPGAGKSALAAHLRATAHRARYNLVALEGAAGDAFLAETLADQLAPVADNPDRRTILIVDDAHALSNEMLARLLSLTDGAPAAQLFLFGRPGLRARIDSEPALEAWRGSIIVAHHLGARAGEGGDSVEAHIARLEAKLAEQEEALRRVLTVMVDWVENGRQARAA